MSSVFRFTFDSIQRIEINQLHLILLCIACFDIVMYHTLISTHPIHSFIYSSIIQLIVVHSLSPRPLLPFCFLPLPAPPPPAYSSTTHKAQAHVVVSVYFLTTTNASSQRNAKAAAIHRHCILFTFVSQRLLLLALNTSAHTSLVVSPASLLLAEMVTPLVKSKKVVKRRKTFPRHYSDRFERLNYGTWRKPKGQAPRSTQHYITPTPASEQLENSSSYASETRRDETRRDEIETRRDEMRRDG